MYWLALVSGLAVLTVQRIDAPAQCLPIWVGGVLGTALGQWLASRRCRLWLTAVIVVNGMFLAALLVAPLWVESQVHSVDALELGVLSFAPAAICAHLALGDRSALAGFWFPALPWTLAMLDAQAASAWEGRWVLLAGPALLLLGLLYTQELRKVALWTGRATTTTLAKARSPVVLREAPGRSLARGAWASALAVLTLAFTVWIAPRLWKKDPATPAAAAAAAIARGVTCCPESPMIPREQVHEYFSPLRVEARPAPRPLDCVDCIDELGALPPAGGTGSALLSDIGDDSAVVAGSGGAGVPSPTAPGAPGKPTAVAVNTNPVAPRAPVPVPTAAPVVGPRDARTSGAAMVAVGRVGTPLYQRDAAELDRAAAETTFFDDIGVFGSLAVLVALGLAVKVAVRPARRLLMLQHLRQPLWPETVDQRVSNLWQLALVGLRDAGLCGVPGEPPRALARRAGSEAMAVCATVLERVRHGVRLDAGDLEAMNRAAASVYRDARRTLGWPARAASWLRWPLV
jgi:hypothetical protein